MKWILREIDLERCFQMEIRPWPQRRELTLAVPRWCPGHNALSQACPRVAPSRLVNRRPLGGSVCLWGTLPALVGLQELEIRIQPRWANDGLVYLVRLECVVLEVNWQRPQKKRINLRTLRRKIRQKVEGKDGLWCGIRTRERKGLGQGCVCPSNMERETDTVISLLACLLRT